MTVVEQVEGPTPASDGFQQHTITLGWEERRQGHGKRISDAGLPFALSLPSGTVLREGDRLVLYAERVTIVVREASEPVYVIHPGTSQQWAFYAYHVGNRHQPVMIGEKELVFLQNPAVKSLLEQLGVPFQTDNRPFTGASAVSGHSH